MPGSIPDLHLHVRVVVDLYRLRAEVDANSKVVRLLESVVNELEKEARLTNAGFSHDNVFEDVSVANNVIVADASAGRCCLHI